MTQLCGMSDVYCFLGNYKHLNSKLFNYSKNYSNKYMENDRDV